MSYPLKHNHHTKTEFKKGHKSLSTPESIRKTSKKMKGRKLSKTHRENISKGRKGIKFSKKHLENMSKSHLKGEPNNQLGRTRLEYYLYREAVLKRDDYVCQKCRTGVNLEIHHLFPWAEFRELRFAINNGITLCKKCHKLIHKKNEDQ